MHADLNFKTCENYLYIEGEKNVCSMLLKATQFT